MINHSIGKWFIFFDLLSDLNGSISQFNFIRYTLFGPKFESYKSNTLVVLASTLYFKASWTNKFVELTPEKVAEQNLCYTTNVEELQNGDCSDVTWLYKEESIPYTKFTGFVQAQVFEIPVKSSASDNGDVTNKVCDRM